MQSISNIKLNTALFLLCVPGIISAILMIPEMPNINTQELPMPMWTLQIVSGIQTSILVILCIVIGTICSKKILLSAPLIEQLIIQGEWKSILWRQLKPAFLAGLIGGIVILIFSNLMTPLLPESFVLAGEKFQPSWYTRVLYGGICEEILIRWGLLSLIVWSAHRLFGSRNSRPAIGFYFAAIFISAIAFALLHLPAVYAISPIVDTPLITYIVIGNSFAGLIAGYLFCQYGLEAAIFSHITFHLVFIIADALF